MSTDIIADNIKTIAVVDLETNGLPWQQGNTCAITELCVYAFSAACIRDSKEDVIVLQLNDDMEVIENLETQPPDLPRVLHKLSLMINPNREIDPVAGKMSGLTNEMLRNEATFDVNTANCLLMFLERLEKPICLVAHNGWTFDYPIIRYVFEAIDMAVPSSIYCIDSYKAFREIDEKQSEVQNIEMVVLAQEESCDFNEVHLHHRTSNITPDGERQICDVVLEEQKRLYKLNMLRTLFVHSFKPKTRFPKKGTYVLGNIFERVFHQPAENLHRAESDVEILTKLILHYGLVFLAYAEERRQSFEEVPRLGCRSD